MQEGPSQDRRYTVVVTAFGVALVVVGLLGVPALLVVAGGALVAAIVIFAFRGHLGAGTGPKRLHTPRSRPAAREEDATAPRPALPPRPLERQYVPSVLEAGGTHRRRAVGRGRGRHRPGRPLDLR